jgi:hypothetical protein
MRNVCYVCNNIKKVFTVDKKTVTIKTNNPIVRVPKSFFNKNDKEVQLELNWDKKQLVIKKVRVIKWVRWELKK